MISAYVVAAMCGCWWWESGVNPAIWESLVVCDWDYVYGTSGPNRGGYGLGQWTNTRNATTGAVGWRLRDLHNWVTSNGYRDGDGAGQLAYIPIENHWVNSSQKRGSYSTLDEFLNSKSKNLDDLVWDFLACWEGVPGNKYEERKDFAKKALDHIKAHKDDNPDDYTWVQKNSYPSESETLNNIMCVYFGVGATPPTPTTKSNHYIWYYLNRIIRRELRTYES